MYLFYEPAKSIFCPCLPLNGHLDALKATFSSEEDAGWLETGPLWLSEESTAGDAPWKLFLSRHLLVSSLGLTLSGFKRSSS